MLLLWWERFDKFFGCQGVPFFDTYNELLASVDTVHAAVEGTSAAVDWLTSQVLDSELRLVSPAVLHVCE